MTDELVAIFPGNHKWAAKHRIMPRDLLGETYIMAARGAGTRAVVEERLKEQGIVLQNVLDFGNLEGVKHAVEVGLGVSIQAGSVVKREIAAGSLRSLPPAGMDTQIEYLYVCRKETLSNAASGFLALLHQQ
jgi:DNA-binding transcriptional LysR family regulator